jgi:N-acetylglutamate synthase-like GNAT family acetyltransferase
MDSIALSLKMKRLSIWLDRQCETQERIRKHFDSAPFGNCYVTMDAARQGPFASGNSNRVHLCGAEPGLEPASLDHLIELFTTAGVKRFFVWLSPGPNMDVVRRWLEERGLSRIRRTGYPTLCREDGGPCTFATNLRVREVTRDDVAAARDQLGDTMWSGYVRSAGKDGFYHFMAFDGDRPVAMAALGVFEDLGYLFGAATAGNDRRRGAQQALIASRVQRAAQIGCSTLVSDTLYMLEHSYRNLQRAGFQEAYEKEVYEWNA